MHYAGLQFGILHDKFSFNCAKIKCNSESVFRRFVKLMSRFKYIFEFIYLKFIEIDFCFIMYRLKYNILEY